MKTPKEILREWVESLPDELINKTADVFDGTYANISLTGAKWDELLEAAQLPEQEIKAFYAKFINF